MLSIKVQAHLNGEKVPTVNNGLRVACFAKIKVQKPRRKLGAWGTLPEAASDWDTVESNAIIGEALSGGKLF